MSEDPRMDKKSHNRTQSQSKALAVDCKKSSELTNKPWPRHNKKREGPGGTPKNDPFRKNAISAKGRGNIDKRPRVRGPTGLVGGVEVTGIAENEPELGSVFVPGRKKQNLNHLLNFVYTPRGLSQRSNVPSYRHHHMQPRATHPHSEHLYLQASCQFVVKEDGDYSVNLVDPDVPIKWDLIEEIVVRSTGRLECPICLGAPVAGRVGRCGHVHCWPCALHYAAAHDRSPPPCPVCAAPFRVDSMKPARQLQWKGPADEVCMHLVRRLRGSTSVEVAPVRGTSVQAEAAVLPYAAIEWAPYCKLFSADEEQVRKILARERKELQDQILAEIDTTEIVFFEQALNKLKLQEESFNNGNKILSYNSAVNVETEEMVPIVYEEQIVSDKKIDWFDMTEELSSSPTDTNIDEHVEDLALALDRSHLNPEAVEFKCDVLEEQIEFPLIEEVHVEEEEEIETGKILTNADKENQAKYFYFYQAEDGQQVFLHSVNVRMLCASWGALVAAPSVIRARVLRRDTASLTEESRKRMPCTAHLPLHCPFEIVELDLQPPHVTQSAIHAFSDELQRRARARVRLEREEKRRERAYRRALEGPPRPDLSSARHFPPASPSASHLQDLPPLTAQPEPEPTLSSSPSPSSSGLSFAKMASTSGTWRVRAPRPVTPPPPPPPDDDAASYAPRALSLSDAIEAALHAAPAGAAPTKNKKKSKQKLLFATGMQRAS
ncbi:RING finger protein 10 [Eumeta japonica]|uniref:E3 ubiquitin-protein ligase RNF10 n=1 Tax=Eumeta variegata TaxID=151549 RepID=A0A4C1TJZ8_EUMVA|nr:RING finger protein 10 [Eumeta japonica]